MHESTQRGRTQNATRGQMRCHCWSSLLHHKGGSVKSRPAEEFCGKESDKNSSRVKWTCECLAHILKASRVESEIISDRLISSKRWSGPMAGGRWHRSYCISECNVRLPVTLGNDGVWPYLFKQCFYSGHCVIFFISMLAF